MRTPLEPEPDLVIHAPEIGRMREAYVNQELVESVLGEPDGTVTDENGKIVGGVWSTTSQAALLRDVAVSAMTKIKAQRGDAWALDQSTLAAIQNEIETSSHFAIATVELARVLGCVLVTTATASVEVEIP